MGVTDGSITADHAEKTVRVTGPVSVVNSALTTLSVQEYANETSLHTAGQVTNILAGQAVCTLTAPPAGFYRVDIHRIAGGSGTPSLFNNGQFRIGATAHVLMSAAVLEIPYAFTFYVELDGLTNLSINAVTDGSPNITIAASITATRMN